MSDFKVGDRVMSTGHAFDKRIVAGRRGTVTRNGPGLFCVDWDEHEEFDRVLLWVSRDHLAPLSIVESVGEIQL